MRLHDARVVGIENAANVHPQSFFIELALENDATRPVFLTYLLAEPLDRSLARPQFMSQPCYWLYDEFDIVNASAPITFSHSILFSNGAELHLRFHDMKVNSFPP